MWTEVLLLAKLAQRPFHGYELRREIEESTGRTLSNNSLYPTLRRFADAGAVIRSAEEQEGKPPRHVYEITAVGRELLHDMLAELPEELAADESEFLARLANFHRLGPPERLRVLDARDRALDRIGIRIAKLASAQEETWSRLVLDRVLHKVSEERAWLAGLRAAATDTQARPEGETR
ncbi:PadR family transcriptional regulator [Amycolatopsis rhizosphaerae]|uniref:PadR family transcriptional regulator n=1 Tax=Amycolatopsis rhizosphaerae TaxID=2053003 RepID=A0A558DEL6_9PSEU|nr:PadR family transcriptional regulator [Amycolatopsis rhizosphaerae]TVT59481.1 PadR family transcriptional regulator [Amycolatopsis rhizosphaerae]